MPVRQGEVIGGEVQSLARRDLFDAEKPLRYRKGSVSEGPVSPVIVYRSLLFVPGSRPDRFGKACAAGADGVIIDLEDAVPTAGKDKAREDVLAWLAEEKAAPAGLRINSPRTSAGCADLVALAASKVTGKLDFLVVPKAETSVDLEIVAEALGRPIPLIAVIESGRALSNAFAIAEKASGGVMFGGVDFSASLGADVSDWDAMLTARGTIAAACGAAGVAAYDVPFLDTADTDGLTVSTRRAKAMGFAGRACIHPDQVAPVNAVYSPTREEVSDARAIIAAMKAAGGGVVLHKGKMIDRPVVLAAERILARVRPD